MERAIIGVERRGMPSPYTQSGTQNYCAVLVRGAGADAACYLGVGPPEWVAENGDKVSLKEASVYFPWIEAELAGMGLSYRGPAGG